MKDYYLAMGGVGVFVLKQLKRSIITFSLYYITL